jgi:hypothetical protein
VILEAISACSFRPHIAPCTFLDKWPLDIGGALQRFLYACVIRGWSVNACVAITAIFRREKLPIS